MPTQAELIAERERRRASASQVAPAAPPAGMSMDALMAERERRRAATSQPASPAVPSSEIDAGIEEAAAAIPGGYANFQKQPPDPARMQAMGYVQDPLAKGGWAKPPVEASIWSAGNAVHDPSTNNLLTDAARFLEAPVHGLTGGGLEGWARTMSDDPLRGATEAVDFISPIDDAGRAYQGLKQAGAGAIDGDWARAGEGLKQAAIDGSFTAMQALPGSMTLKGVTAPGRAATVTAQTLADAERAAVQASRAPSVPRARAAIPKPVESAPVPFSAPAEPAGRGAIMRNADRIVGGAVGATVGGMGDAFAAPDDGSEGGGPPVGAGVGAAIGVFGPRAAASAANRARRGLQRGFMNPAARASFDERVAARAVRKALQSAGIQSADEASAAFTARFGDKPASIADLSQEATGTAAGLSRLPGATGEAARARGEDLLQNRAGRLEGDIAQANPSLNPAAIAGDVDRMVQLAQQQAKPAYDGLRARYPLGSIVSDRLEQLRGLDILAPHIRGVDRYRETLAATEGRAVGDFEYWDLVKRSLDDTEQAAIARSQPVPYDLDSARRAIVEEMDRLVPDYPAARELGGEAPKMRDAFRQGQALLGGRYTAEDVARLIQGITGQQLTAAQAGVIRSMVGKTEGARGAMASLMSTGARKKLAQVFGQDAADAMQARFAADATIVNNAHRINPNVGSVTSQAQLGGGLGPMVADAIRAVRNPAEAALAALSRSGSYSKAQRDLMGQMLLDGATPENLARIFGRQPPRPRRSPPGAPIPPAGAGGPPVQPPVTAVPTTGPRPQSPPGGNGPTGSRRSDIEYSGFGFGGWKPPKGQPGPPRPFVAPEPIAQASAREVIDLDTRGIPHAPESVKVIKNPTKSDLARLSVLPAEERAAMGGQRTTPLRYIHDGEDMYVFRGDIALHDDVIKRLGLKNVNTSSSGPMGRQGGGMIEMRNGEPYFDGKRIDMEDGGAPPAPKPPITKQGFGSDLPMDEGARMARMKEQGYEGGWFHASRTPLDSFDTSKGQLGLHIGTKEAAEHIASGTQSRPYNAKMDWPVAAVVARGKYAKVPDLGKWDSGSYQLAREGSFSKRNASELEFDPRFNDMWEALDDFAASRPNMREWQARVQSETAKRGLAGWEYVNRAEAPGSTSRIVMEPQAIRRTDAKFDPAESGSSKLLAGMGENATGVGAATGIIAGGTFAPDANGDGVVDAQERANGALGGAFSGGVLGAALGRGANKLAKGNRLAEGPRRTRAPDQATFGGVNAKTADRVALGRAQKMEAEGASRDEIWDATGWFKGVDGKWRFEIDDSGARLRSNEEVAAIGESMVQGAKDLESRVKQSNAALREQPDLFPAALKRVHADMRKRAKGMREKANENFGPTWNEYNGRRLEYDLDHPAMIAAYPQLARDIVISRPGPSQFSPSLKGSYTDNRIKLNGPRNSDQTSTTLHETQHALQEAEGFATGGSPESAYMTDGLRKEWTQEIDKILTPAPFEKFAANSVFDGVPEAEVRSQYKAMVDEMRAASKNIYHPLSKTVQNTAAYNIYKRLAGEVEARNVQTRRDFTPEQRRAKRPWETQDVPDDQQIVRFGAGKAESRPRRSINSQGFGGGKGPPKPPQPKGPPKKAEEIALREAVRKTRANEARIRRETVMRDNRDELRAPSEEARLQAERNLNEYLDRQHYQAANAARWKDRGALVANVGKKVAVSTGNALKRELMKEDHAIVKGLGIGAAGIGIAGIGALASGGGGKKKPAETYAPTDPRYFFDKVKKDSTKASAVQNAYVKLGLLDAKDADGKWGAHSDDATKAWLAARPDRNPKLPLQDYEVLALLAEAYGGYQEGSKWYYNNGEPIVFPLKTGQSYLPNRPLRPDEARRMTYDKRTKANAN